VSEHELTRRFADAVADEPPLDLDALIAAATGPPQPRRDRRRWAVLASAAATVAIVTGVLTVSRDDSGAPAVPPPTTGPAAPTSTVTAPTTTTTPAPPRVVDLNAAAAAMSAVGPQVVRDHGVELLPGAPPQPWRPYSDQYWQQVSGSYRLAAVPVGADTSTLSGSPSVGLMVQHTGSTLDPSVLTRPWAPREVYPPVETTLPDGSLLRVYEGYDVGSGTQYLNITAAVHLRTDGIIVYASTALVGLPGTPRPAFLVDPDTLVALATDPRLTM
jgi:hypothetical protein